MTKENLLKAIEIMTENHSNELIINKVQKSGYVGDTISLNIKSCVPAVITKLADAGFMLSMKDGLLSVDDTLIKYKK